MLLRSLACTVRLQTLDQCDCIGRHPTNTPWSEGFFRRCDGDWEARLVVRHVLIGEDKLVRKMIEAGSQIVNAIANQERKAAWRLIHR
jgi:hypothetical protein